VASGGATGGVQHAVKREGGPRRDGTVPGPAQVPGPRQGLQLSNSQLNLGRFSLKPSNLGDKRLRRQNVLMFS
jgi:hypothetical protein